MSGERSVNLSGLTIEHGDSGNEYQEEMCVGEGGHFWEEDLVCGSVTWYNCERCSVPAWLDSQVSLEALGEPLLERKQHPADRLV